MVNSRKLPLSQLGVRLKIDKHPVHVGLEYLHHLRCTFNAVSHRDILALDHLGLKRDVVYAHVREHGNGLFQDTWPLVKVR